MPKQGTYVVTLHILRRIRGVERFCICRLRIVHDYFSKYSPYDRISSTLECFSRSPVSVYFLNCFIQIAFSANVTVLTLYLPALIVNTIHKDSQNVEINFTMGAKKKNRKKKERRKKKKRKTLMQK